MSRPSTVAEAANLAFLTQTTLSVDDTAAIVAALQRRFPAIRAPRSEDICYATSNRQAAVKAIAAECDRMLVIGAPEQQQFAAACRSRRAARRPRAPDRARRDIDWDWLGQPATLGITAGASAPGSAGARSRRCASRTGSTVTEESADHTPERMIFKLPRELVA